MKSVDLPFVERDGRKWILLSALGRSGILRAAHIAKPKQVPDWDSHHCDQVQAKSSMRFHAKQWTTERNA